MARFLQAMSTSSLRECVRSIGTIDMKNWKYIVWVDGFPYKKYMTLTGAELFVKKLPQKEKDSRQIFIKKY